MKEMLLGHGRMGEVLRFWKYFAGRAKRISQCQVVQCRGSSLKMADLFGKMQCLSVEMGKFLSQLIWGRMGLA
jgi:hypothetical protein